LFAAETVAARGGIRVESLPIEETLEIMKKYNRLR
jgi:hypothetical protein